MPLRIAVVGCGTAGPAAALLLARAGHDVEVLERAPDLSPIGAGLLLQPTGMAVLRELGLLDEIERRGARVERLHGETDGGRVVMDIAYADLEPGLHGLGLHRGALFGALFGALGEAGIAVRTGVGIARAGRDGSLTTTDGERLGPYDLVVGADGARSTVRAATRVCRSDERYPWGALWAILDDPEGRHAGVLSQVYRSTTEMLGFLPTGEGRVSLFWSVRCADGERDELKRRMRALTPRADHLLDQLAAPSQVLFAAYRDVRTRGRWHDGRIVLLGDAGHAMSPQLGQGANLALIDAWCLSCSLAEARDDVDAALERYSARRRAHLRFYATASRWLTPLFQADRPLLARPRDALMHPVARRVPWVNRQMVATLAGSKTGPFRELPRGELPQKTGGVAAKSR
jgi:2-polyprenyl-6-methoxyphenol hydroxylase-like FAD-dependent oxidoreductase